MKRRVAIGPWRGGLNLRTDAQLVRDDELIRALNVVVRSDGAVVNRPGMQNIPPSALGGMSLRASANDGIDFGERLDVIGFLNDTTYIVARASWSTSTKKWETNAIWAGVVDASITNQAITWSDTGFSSSTLLGSELITTSDDRDFEVTAGSYAGLFASFARVTTPVDSGVGALQYTHNTSNPSREALTATLYTGVTAGNEYTVSLRMRRAATVTTGQAAIQFYDAGSVAVGLPQFGPNITLSTSAYTSVSSSFVAPATATKFTVGFRANDSVASNITYIDNISTKEGSLPYIVKALTYGDSVYLIPNDSTATMLKSTITGTTVVLNSVTKVPIPKGLFFNPGGQLSSTQNQVGNLVSIDTCFIWKDRLFIARKDRIYFSQATNFTVWSSAPGLGGFFDVGGDIDSDLNYITATVLSGDTLFIFKSQGTYAFTFQVDPNTDGYLRTLTDKQGAHSAISWRNRIFTVDNKSVYEFVSGQFIDIAQKLDLMNNNSGYSTSNSSGAVIPSLHVMSDFLVLGPLIALQTPESSGRYYAMNLNNGAWAQWDVYGGAFQVPYTAQGNTDTLKCQGFSGTVVAPQHGFFQLGTSEKGTVLVFMNFNETQPYVTDGLSTNQRLPNSYFETKKFTFDSNVEYKKVYRIQIDRGLGTTDAGGSGFDKGGFGANYQTAGDLVISSTFNEVVQDSVDKQFGSLSHSQFRALGFSLFYEFYYINQQTFAVSVPTKVYRFKINGMFVYLDAKADFSNIQALGTT